MFKIQAGVVWEVRTYSRPSSLILRGGQWQGVGRILAEMRILSFNVITIKQEQK